MKRALITSGWWESTNLFLQTLGRLGWEVHLFTLDPESPATRSRYCARHIPSPSEEDAPRYVEALLGQLRAEPYDLFIPISDAVVRAVAPHAAAIREHSRMMLPDAEAVRVAGDKAATMRLAMRLGIPVPETSFLRSPEDAEGLAATMTYPCVVKKSVSSGGLGVAIVRDPAALVGAVRRFTAPGEPLPIIQRFVEGDIADYAALADRGEVVAGFAFDCRIAHLSGSSPWLSSSSRDPRLADVGRRLVRELNWTGPIDFDFLRDRDGNCSLLEINPRFSGTTLFAVQLGIDLPGLYVRLAMGEAVSGPGPLPPYPDRVRYQNVFFASVDAITSRPLRSLGPILLTLLDPRIHHNVLFHDRPLVATQFRRSIRQILRGWYHAIGAVGHRSDVAA